MSGAARRAALTASLTLSASAAPLTGPGVRAPGQVIQASGDGPLTVTQTFTVATPTPALSGAQRAWLRLTRGTLRVTDARLGWACPPGRGKRASTGEAVTLRQFAFAGDQSRVNDPRPWQQFVTPLPDLQRAVTGPELLRHLDQGHVTLTATFTLPAPAAAWHGCRPTLHARTSFQ